MLGQEVDFPIATLWLWALVALLAWSPGAEPLCKRQDFPSSMRACGVVVSHPLRMRKALGSIPSMSIAITAVDVLAADEHQYNAQRKVTQIRQGIGRAFNSMCFSQL